MKGIINKHGRTKASTRNERKQSKYLKKKQHILNKQLETQE